LGDKKYDFSKFKLQIQRSRRTPISDKAYSRWGFRNGFAVKPDFTLEEIYDIIRNG